MSTNPQAALIAASRFGFAPGPGELAEIARDPRGWVVAQLGRKVEIPGDLPTAREMLALVLEARKEKQERPETQQRFRQTYLGELDARMRAAILGNTPVLERLTQFWSNHFTVSGMRPVVRGA